MVKRTSKVEDAELPRAKHVCLEEKKNPAHSTAGAKRRLNSARRTCAMLPKKCAYCAYSHPLECILYAYTYPFTQILAALRRSTHVPRALPARRMCEKVHSICMCVIMCETARRTHKQPQGGTTQ